MKDDLIGILKEFNYFLLTAEPQSAQSFWFFFLFAETPKRKTTQPFG